jgi:hypothetical protein
MGNQALAMQYAHEICEYLEQKGSEAMEFPILAYLTCARVFEGSGDQERRQEVIGKGYQQLLTRAQKISNKEWRELFLHKLIENHQLNIFNQDVKDICNEYR